MSGCNIIIQERDIKILEWLIEMKFSDISIIQRKFFSENSIKSNGPLKRLNKLREKGLITVQFGFDGSRKSYYRASDLAYFLRKNSNLPKPVRRLEPATFIHDRMVIECRIALERAGKCSEFMSEHFIRSHFSYLNLGLTKKQLPDGIFLNENGKWVALELERTPKLTSRYLEKVQKFNLAMARKDSLFDECLFVTENCFAHNKLLEFTKSKPRFKVITFKELVG